MRTFLIGASLFCLTGIALAQEHTLTIYSSWDKLEYVDINPPGLSVGDMYLRRGEVSLSAGGPAAGEFYSVATMVYLDQSGKISSLFSSEVILPEGSLYTTDFVQCQTACAVESGSGHKHDGAIIGGTGAYAGIRGHYTLERLPSDEGRKTVKTVFPFWLNQ
ncbi:MAG: hypothetical protein ACO4CP_09120 [Steroidobacteraceae bacterium]